MLLLLMLLKFLLFTSENFRMQGFLKSTEVRKWEGEFLSALCYNLCDEA